VIKYTIQHWELLTLFLRVAGASLDNNRAEGATFETRHVDFPFLSAVCVFDLPSLYAGKLHALLCREYLKGRDSYDFIWYTARQTPADYEPLSSALNQTGPWKGKNDKADRTWCLEQLQERLKAIDWKQAREDVRRFVKSNELPSLELWNAEFFQAQATKLTYMIWRPSVSQKPINFSLMHNDLASIILESKW